MLLHKRVMIVSLYRVQQLCAAGKSDFVSHVLPDGKAFFISNLLRLLFFHSNTFRVIFNSQVRQY